MNQYQVFVDKRVQQFFRKLPEKQARQLQAGLIRLGINPHPQDSRKLMSSGGYRITVGEYRILYTIDEENAIVNGNLIATRNAFSY